MTLAHSELHENIYFKRNNIAEWIVESPELFGMYIGELYEQYIGKDGRFALSHDEKLLDVSRSMEIIFHPFSLDINEKKLLSKIYIQLQTLANDEIMYLKTREIIQELQQYFFELEQNYEITLTIEDDIDLQILFKLLGVKTESTTKDYFEKLMLYIRLQNIFLSKKLFVLVNARCYLSDEQIIELSLFAQHNEVYILFYEGYQRDFTNFENRYIIDKDKCEI